MNAPTTIAEPPSGMDLARAMAAGAADYLRSIDKPTDYERGMLAAYEAMERQL